MAGGGLGGTRAEVGRDHGRVVADLLGTSLREQASTVEHVDVFGHQVAVKIVTLPDGSRRTKPEFVDVQRAALATGRPLQDIFKLALIAAER